MKRIGYCATAALLAILMVPQPGWAWNWNPFAKSTDSAAEKSSAKAAKSDKAAQQSKEEKSQAMAREAIKLKQAARSASQTDKATMKRKQPIDGGKQAWSPDDSRYRWSAAKQPGPARRAVNSTVNALTLKPLRNKLSGNPTTHNPWSKTPPVTNTSAKQRPGMLGSLFKPKPKKKTGPQTVNEWLAQDRPSF